MPATGGWAWSIPGWLIGSVSFLLGCVILGEGATLMLVMASPETPAAVSATAPGPEPIEAPATEEPAPSLAGSISRPIFAVAEPRSAPSPSGQAGGPRAPSPEVKQLATRLSLIGVVMGESPQAIIQDSQSGKTFFVTTGQVVVDGMVVESLQENRVVLSLDGETIDLSL